MAKATRTMEKQQLVYKLAKKATFHVQHTFFCKFLCRYFAQLQRETSRNFLITRNVVRVLVQFFSAVAHFHPGGRRHFSFSHRRYEISCCFSNKNDSFVFTICWITHCFSSFDFPFQTLYSLWVIRNIYQWFNEFWLSFCKYLASSRTLSVLELIIVITMLRERWIHIL